MFQKWPNLSDFWGGFVMSKPIIKIGAFFIGQKVILDSTLLYIWVQFCIQHGWISNYTYLCQFTSI